MGERKSRRSYDVRLSEVCTRAMRIWGTIEPEREGLVEGRLTCWMLCCFRQQDCWAAASTLVCVYKSREDMYIPSK